MANVFEQADRTSDRIVTILRDEVETSGSNPVMIFCGQLLAIISFGQTAPAMARPPEFVAVLEAAFKCARSIHRKYEKQEALKAKVE